MQHIEWHENYTLGFAELDDDHRRLIDLVNGLMTALGDQDSEECARLSADFVIALKRHYPREERFLKKIGYTGLEQHAINHRQMLAGAEEFMALCKTEKNGEVLAARLEKLVADLLADVRGGDFDFNQFLLEKGLDKALSDRPLISMWL